MASNRGDINITVGGDSVALDKTISDVNAKLGSLRKSVATALSAAGLGDAGGVAEKIDKVGHSSTAARRELLVLTHELATGNTSRFGGSLLVLAERIDLIGKLTSPAGLAIAGLVAGVGALAVAAAKGAAEQSRLNDSIQLTGNYAGVTLGRLDEIAHKVADSANITIGSSRDLVEALVASGKFTADELEPTAEVIAKIATLSHESFDKVEKDFEKLGEDVAKFAEEHIATSGRLTAAQIAYIRQLQETQGPLAAAKQYEQDLNEALGQTNTHLGLLERAFKGAQRGASDFWDTLKGLGRDKTVEERIAAIRARLDELNRAKAGIATGGNNLGLSAGELDVEIGRQQSKLDPLLAKKAGDDQAAADASADRQRQVALVKAADAVSKIRETVASNDDKMKKELADFVKNSDLLVANGQQTLAERADLIAKIKAKYAPKGSEIDTTGLRLKPLEDSITAENKLLTRHDQQLDRAYKADEISSADYFEQKRAALDANNLAVQDAYARELAIVQAGIAKAKNAQQRTTLETKAVGIRDAAQQAADDAAAKRVALDDEQKAAAEKYAAAVDKLSASLLQLQERTVEAATINFDEQYRQLREQATKANDFATLKNLDTLRGLTIAKAGFDEFEKQVGDIENRLAQKQQQIANQATTGLISERDAREQQIAANQQAADELDVLIAKYQQLALASGNPAILKNVEELRGKVIELRDATSETARRVASDLRSGFESSFADIISGTKSVSSAFRSLLLDVQKMLSQIAAQQIVEQIAGKSGSGGDLFTKLGRAFAGDKSPSGAKGFAGETAAPAANAVADATGKVAEEAGKGAIASVESSVKGFFSDVGNSFESGFSGFEDQLSKILSSLGSLFSGSGGGSGGGGFLSSLGSLFGGGGGAAAAGTGSAEGDALFAGIGFHTGGIAGEEGRQARMVPSLAYALAPRYHGGGIAGLMPDEIPAVLRKGEEILTRSDPRHRENGGRNGSNAPAPVVNVSIQTPNPQQFQKSATQIAAEASLALRKAQRNL